MQELGLLPEIKFCAAHANINKNKIPLERIMNVADKSSYMRVYFETMKCKMCENLADQMVKCPNCSSVYCKDCMIYQKDEKLAIFSGMEQSCKVCLHKFRNFDYQLSKLDHFKVHL